MNDNQSITRNVKDFFKYRYDNYLSLSSETSSLRSINFGNTAVSHSMQTDSQQRIYLRIMDAQKIIKSVDDAIESCRNDTEHPYRKILTLRYIQHRSTVYVISQLSFEKTFYYRNLLPNTLIEFANKFLVKQLVNGVENIIDLTASTAVKSIV